MIRIGLTGSIGMGKSSVADMLRALGVPVFDADAVVHPLQGPGGMLLPAIEAEFPGTTGPGGVDRVRLGARVFADPATLARLEAIVHPAVGAARDAFVAAHSNAPVIVFDIPLLLEKGSDTAFDAIWVVSAPPEVQRARVLARPGMTPETFEAILARQLPDAQKRARATHVIDTGGTLVATRAQVARLVACLSEGEGR